MRKLFLVSQTTASLVHWAEKYDVVGLNKQEISMTRWAKASSSSHTLKPVTKPWTNTNPGKRGADAGVGVGMLRGRATVEDATHPSGRCEPAKRKMQTT